MGRLTSLTTLAAFVGCTGSAPDTSDASGTIGKAMPTPTPNAVVDTPTPSGPSLSTAPPPALTTAYLAAITRELSADHMEGRRPGTPGAGRAVAYVIDAMKKAGLSPAGEHGGWTQRVPMRAVRTDGDRTHLSLSTGQSPPRSLAFGVDVAGGSLGPAGEHSLIAPLLFVGYGITAPEYAWDDYAGVDAKGKIVVTFVGDPPVRDGRFAGDSMTYYGRWTYKFERAQEAGALGCLIIHEADAASYGWNVVNNSWSGERFHAVEPGGELPDALRWQGWITSAVGEDLARGAGTTLAAWHTKALGSAFRAQDLDVRLNGTFAVTERRVEDVNVVGRLAGTTFPEEAVRVSAHWDHLGIKDDAPSGEDRVFNGAVDNASGIAGMLAVAGDLAARKPGPVRSVVFLATTAEEQGLLGSKYYATHPLMPLANIRAVINLDSMNVEGRTKTIQVVGMGQSDLEDTLATVAEAQGRTLVPDERPEAGAYYRSDHFSFAREGVPAIYFRGGKDMADGGTARGEALAEIKARNYHTVSDQFDSKWSFEGALQDAQAVAELVMSVASSEAAPTWRPSSEFARLRPAH